MPEIEYTTISVTSPNHGAVPNRFLKQVAAARGLMVIFPGLNYSCDNPLLYYLSRLAVERSADVLQLRVDYTVPEFQSRSQPDQVQWLLEDALALIEAGQKNRRYERLVLAGKSIGTLTLAALFNEVKALAIAPAIWLTPLFRYPAVQSRAMQPNGRALFISGTADSTYDGEAMKRISSLGTARALTIPKADHSLEIPENVGGSLEALQTIVAAESTFLDDALSS